MSYLAQKSCLLRIKDVEFIVLAILMHSNDGDNKYSPVLQVQNPKSGEIVYFGMKYEFLVEFDEHYELVAK